jgi:hypothetical protein
MRYPCENHVASESDAQYAVRMCKDLRDVTSETYQVQGAPINQRKHCKREFAALIALSPTSVPLSSPSTTSTSEILGERATRLLGCCPTLRAAVAQPIGIEPASSTDACLMARMKESHLAPHASRSHVLLESVRSCLSAVEAVQRAVRNGCQLQSKQLIN